MRPHGQLTESAAASLSVPLVRQVINETLRLYPPVPFNLRTAVKDDVLPNGYFVPAGMLMTLARVAGCVG